MRGIAVMAGLLLVLVAWGGRAAARSFPSTGDATLAEQQRWGSVAPGYIAEGCWHGPSATTTATIASCRAFVLETDTPQALTGFEDTTPQTISYAGGDGTYWLGGRSNPGTTPAGWDCQAGLHYCTLKADTPPAAASGLLLLGKTTVSGGAISAFTIMAPWRRSTPYTVPAGTTLTFGVCPEAGPWHIFDAMGDGSSGSVAFTPEACLFTQFEWWGADPTGLVDATTRLRRALSASRHKAEIRCAGDYLISATAPAQALTLIGGEQIVGKRVSSASMVPTVNPETCRFTFVGSGDAIGTTETSESKPNIRLEKLYIWDRDGSGSRGINFWAARTAVIRDVLVRGFETGVWIGGTFYYGEIAHLKVDESRLWCMDMAGAATNDIAVDLGCNSGVTATTGGGFRIGSAAGVFGTSSNIKLRLLVEVNAGTPVQISRVRGIDANIYIEHPGALADYSTVGAVQVARVEGGRMHVRARGFALAGGGNVPIGIRVLTSADIPDNPRNILFTGNIIDYVTPIVIGSGEGVWGIELGGLMTGGPAITTQAFSTGVRLGNNYLTHGGAPAENTGRGSDEAEPDTLWQVGDLIFNAGGDGLIYNYLRQVTVAGNPPTVATVMLPTISELAGDATATPTVRQGNTLFTRMTLGAGTDVTDFIDEAAGQCLILRATAARTIVDGATIELTGSSSFAMTAGDMLHLCSAAGIWREVGRGDN